ncbi:MAG: chemotaxis protein CheD [Candidatus Hodarchaeota archaeon]
MNHFLEKEDNLAKESHIYYVGIGEIKVGIADDKLKISSLGSCIGLVIYPKDKNPNRCAVMGHIMLPRSQKTDRVVSKGRWGPTRFADIAVPTMIEQLEKIAGKNRRKDFVAKMIGGAEMFGYTKLTMKIGEENARVTKALLQKGKIPLIMEFTGGDTGMSVDFCVDNYILTVKATGGNPIQI